MRRSVKVAILLFAIVGLFFIPRCVRPPVGELPEVKLLVFLVIDQGRYDYFERFRPLFKSGLKELLDGGVSFVSAYHDHAITVTAPGHATLSTGSHPARSGIIGNSWYERTTGKSVSSVYDSVYGVSPQQLKVATLGDWMKQQSRQARVFAVSGKDRAAVLLAGKKADGAYWFSPEHGRFVSSWYYAFREPAWLRQFNAKLELERFFGSLWEPLAVTDTALAKAQIFKVDQGAFRRDFPYSFGGASLKPNYDFYEAISNSPFLDQVTFELASRLVEEERLGEGERTDMLAISLSAVDYIGHSFGPNSREVLDAMLRVDLWLGEFLTKVRTRLAPKELLIVLSSDHGVSPLPELPSVLNGEGHRTTSIDVACYQQVYHALRKRFGAGDYFLADWYVDYDELREKSITFSAFSTALREALKSCPTVERLWSRDDLEFISQDALQARYAHAFSAERSPDFLLQYKRGVLPMQGQGTTHLSPYDYDSHVPLIFYHPSLPARSIVETVHTVDIAPTIAGLLGVRIPQEIDGQQRCGLLRAGATGQ